MKSQREGPHPQTPGQLHEEGSGGTTGGASADDQPDLTVFLLQGTEQGQRQETVAEQRWEWLVETGGGALFRVCLEEEGEMVEPLIKWVAKCQQVSRRKCSVLVLPALSPQTGTVFSLARGTLVAKGLDRSSGRSR